MALQQEIETNQNRAARFVASNHCFETGNMLGKKAKIGVSQETEEIQYGLTFL